MNKEYKVGKYVERAVRKVTWQKSIGKKNVAETIREQGDLRVTLY